MDLKEILKKSKDFYRYHNLGEWAEDLPDKLRSSQENEELFEKAERLGLNQAMVFPEFQIQKKYINTVINECAYKPLEGVEIDKRYANTYISDNWAKDPNGRVYQRSNLLGARHNGPYLLLYNLERIEEATIGKNGKQIAKLFHDKNLTSFTAPELLITSREWRESKIENRVNENSPEFKDYYWVWLVDSGDKENCSAAFYGIQTVGIYACRIGSSNKDRGANITVVIPL